MHQTVPPVHHQTLGGLAGEHRALGPGQHVNMLFFLTLCFHYTVRVPTFMTSLGYFIIPTS